MVENSLADCLCLSQQHIVIYIKYLHISSDDSYGNIDS